MHAAARLGFVACLASCGRETPAETATPSEPVAEAPSEVVAWLDVEVIGGGNAYAARRAVDAVPWPVRRDETRALHAFPLLTDDDVSAFSKAFALSGALLPICTAEPAPPDAPWAWQQVVWRRGDGLLDSFVVVAVRPHGPGPAFAFLLRGRRAGDVTLSAAKCHRTDEGEGAPHLTVRLALGSSDYANAILEEAGAEAWWLAGRSERAKELPPR